MSCHSHASFDGATPLPVPGNDDVVSAVLHRVMAREIVEIREKLEALAETLVCDEHFAANYLEQLQTFDYVIQHAEECVNLLTRIADGAHSSEAIAHVRLGAVQDRLRHALSGG